MRFTPQDIIKGIRTHFYMHHLPSPERLAQAFGHLAQATADPLPEAAVHIHKTRSRTAANRWVAQSTKMPF